MTERSVCRSCGKPLLWAAVGGGKRIPLDAEPTPRGNVRLARVAGVLTAFFGAGYPADAAPHLSHFATCSFAARHRRKKATPEQPSLFDSLEDRS